MGQLLEEVDAAGCELVSEVLQAEAVGCVCIWYPYSMVCHSSVCGTGPSDVSFVGKCCRVDCNDQSVRGRRVCDPACCGDAVS